MFHSIKLKPIEFKSNPELDPLPVVTLKMADDGVTPINEYEFIKQDHRSPLSGAHYDPSVMSLRSKLIRGVTLQTVNYDVTENDPNKLAAAAERVSIDLQTRAASRKSNVDSSNSVSSNS